MLGWDDHLPLPDLLLVIPANILAAFIMAGAWRDPRYILTTTCTVLSVATQRLGVTASPLRDLEKLALPLQDMDLESLSSPLGDHSVTWSHLPCHSETWTHFHLELLSLSLMNLDSPASTLRLGVTCLASGHSSTCCYLGTITMK